MKNEFNVKEEFNKKISRVFLFCPRTQELKEYREEVLGAIMDKYADLTSHGYAKDVAFDMCCDSIEQFYDKNIVKQLEEIKGTKKSSKVSKEVLKLGIWGGLLYVILTLVLFFTLAFIPSVGWGNAAIVFGVSFGGAILGLILFAIIKTHAHSAYSMSRLNIWLIGMTLVTIIYLIVSFSLHFGANIIYYFGINDTASVWALTWLTFIFGLVAVDCADLAYRMSVKKKIYSAIDAFILTTFVTLSVYLSSSIISDIVCDNSIWAKSWIIFFFGILLYVFMMFMRQIFKLKNASKANK